MSDTNFYDSLVEFSHQHPLRLCMPGHKGKPMPMEEWNALASLDFTELTPTGDLYGGNDWLEDAQRLWAWDWGMDTAFFATGGSTQGIFTLLTLFTRPGDRVLIDRVSHRSIHNACALFDLHPLWLERPWQENCAVTGAISPETVENTLANHPDITAVVITSPTYYGVLSDVTAIAGICHAHGAKLIVDGAHGAHLPLVLSEEKNCLLGCNPYAACDGVTVSAHKTLAAPGQTAVVFANGVSLEELRQASALTSTTSPSFVMLAALDKLRPWLWDSRSEWQRAAAQCATLRRDYPCLPMEDTELDPCRVVLQVEDGKQLAAALEEQNVYVEMSDRYHVVCIFTGADSDGDFARFRQVLEQMGLYGRTAAVPNLPAPPLPEQILSPRQARFARQETLRLMDAEGAIAAQPIAPYPPGVPVVAPGERITKKTIAYLKRLCYDDKSAILTVK